MQTRDHVRQVMSETGPLLELAAVAEAEDGAAWALTVDESTVVFVELDEGNDRIVVSVEIGKPPDANREQLLETLLVYNGQWTRTGGVRMVLDEPGGQVVQMFDLPASELEVSRFVGVLVKFVDICVGWRNVVLKQGELTGQDQSESGPAPDAGLRV